MEAAYGLAITVTMLMTTLLLAYYLYSRHVPKWVVAVFLVVYLAIELSFLAANMLKFAEGGWVTVAIGLVLSSIMYVWIISHRIKNRLVDRVSLPEQIPALKN